MLQCSATARDPSDTIYTLMKYALFQLGDYERHLLARKRQTKSKAIQDSREIRFYSMLLTISQLMIYLNFRQ